MRDSWFEKLNQGRPFLSFSVWFSKCAFLVIRYQRNFRDKELKHTTRRTQFAIWALLYNTSCLCTPNCITHQMSPRWNHKVKNAWSQKLVHRSCSFIPSVNYRVVSNNPINGAGQKAKRFWNSVLDQFRQKSVLGQERKLEAIKNKWKTPLNFRKVIFLIIWEGIQNRPSKILLQIHWIFAKVVAHDSTFNATSNLQPTGANELSENEVFLLLPSPNQSESRIKFHFTPISSLLVRMLL